MSSPRPTRRSVSHADIVTPQPRSPAQSLPFVDQFAHCHRVLFEWIGRALDIGFNERQVNCKAALAGGSLNALGAALTFEGMETAIAAARSYRRSMKLSQAAFATRFGLPLSTFKQWERGVRVPDSASEVLLRVIVADPDVVERVVRKMRSGD
jgi:DNA-binding transcriptional regulator YiaG